MRTRLVGLVLLALLALPFTALAQTTTGTIIGTVTDASGAVLPGVSVTIRGATIVGVQTSVTNEKGLYRFAGLPQGAYDLTCTLSGFATTTRKDVHVNIGGTSEENVALKVSQLQEEVTVTGEAAVIETQSNAVSTNYDKDWVRNAPLRRFTFFDLINAAPGVSQNTSTSSRSTSLGSSTTDNAYLLDGTDFTAPLTGAAWPWPNTDAIEGIEILSLGAPAEYGNLQGAVFNVVTRQGSNAFHGDANGYWQTQGLTGRNTTEAQDGGLPYHRDRYKDATFQLSGPIFKDKVWFFGSYQYQRDADSQPGTDPAFPARSDADRIFFKLNWQINAKNKVFFALHDDYYAIPERATANRAPSTILVERGHNPSPNVTFTSVLSDKTYVEARYSGFYGKDHGDPLNANCPYPCPSSARVHPRFFDNNTGNITGGVYYWYDGESWKSAFAGKLSHFADDFLGGSHDFKFGVQYNSGGSNYVQGYNDYIYTTTYEDGSRYGYGYSRLPYHYGGEMRNVGVFADDTFRVNSRLTLNLGLRYDYSKGLFPAYPFLDRFGDETGQTSAANDKLFTWNTISPRIGFNYKLTGDGKTVVRGHYGRYYRGVVTGEFAALTPTVPQVFFGVWDFDNERFFPDSLEVVSDNTNLRIDPGFKAPYTDQIAVSFERELFRDLGVAVHYTHKRGERYGGWNDIGGQYVPVPYVDDQGQDATGDTITVQRLVNDPTERLFLLTNPDQMFTRYNGVILQLNKRMSHNWQMVTSLTLGKSEGRIGSSSGRSTPISGQTGTAGQFGQNPNDFINSDGLLIGDRPVQFKTQLVYQAPHGFLLGANFTYQSGRPWARTVRVPGLGITSTVLAESIDGSRRVADWKLLDLRLQKEFSLGGRANLAFFGDLLNTFNNDAYENVESTRGTTDNFGKPSRFLFPRRLMLGAKFRF
jgi:Carboxypeptidase regulatory-like domain/TonB dependent receptor-like, beta-barrel